MAVNLAQAINEAAQGMCGIEGTVCYAHTDRYGDYQSVEPGSQSCEMGMIYAEAGITAAEPAIERAIRAQIAAWMRGEAESAADSDTCLLLSSYADAIEARQPAPGEAQ